MGLRRGFRFIIAILTCLGAAPAFADMTVLTYNMRFCPSWAEAHERSLADLNHGRPPFPVKWKGCIVVRRGTCVDVVEQQDQSTEIVIRGKHWITDEMPDVIPGACPKTSSARDKVAARNEGTPLDTLSTTPFVRPVAIPPQSEP